MPCMAGRWRYWSQRTTGAGYYDNDDGDGDGDDNDYDGDDDDDDDDDDDGDDDDMVLIDLYCRVPAKWKPFWHYHNIPITGRYHSYQSNLALIHLSIYNMHPSIIFYNHPSICTIYQSYLFIYL